MNVFWELYIFLAYSYNPLKVPLGYLSSLLQSRPFKCIFLLSYVPIVRVFSVYLVWCVSLLQRQAVLHLP